MSQEARRATRKWGPQGCGACRPCSPSPPRVTWPEAFPGHPETAEPPGEHEKTGVEGIYSRKLRVPRGDSYWLQAPEALVGSAEGRAPLQGAGGRQGLGQKSGCSAVGAAEGAPPSHLPAAPGGPPCPSLGLKCSWEAGQGQHWSTSGQGAAHQALVAPLLTS